MRLPPAPATIVLVATISLCWLLLQMFGLQDAVAASAFVPARFDMGGVARAVPTWLTPLTATLLHANLMHLGFNMLMLGFCGRYVETALRAPGIVVLYGVGAYAAALGQYLVDPGSTVPMIGASGAVSALFGAYALLFGQQKSFSANRAVNRTINVAWLAVAWIAVQLLFGLATRQESGGIAIFAHIGGFLAGLALARPLLALRYRSA